MTLIGNVLNSASSVTMSEGEEVVFGSLTVDANSATPYTDATQVGKLWVRAKHTHTHFEDLLILAYHMTWDLGVRSCEIRKCTLNAAIFLPANLHFSFPLWVNSFQMHLLWRFFQGGLRESLLRQTHQTLPSDNPNSNFSNNDFACRRFSPLPIPTSVNARFQCRSSKASE